MSLKICVIGGGSSYTPEIIEGIINRHHRFPVSEIVLVDTEQGQQKLTVIYELALRMIKQSNKKIHLSKTLDLEIALNNVDFVVTQIRVGGLDARLLDEKIPLSHGLIGQETNGAGGIFNAFRTIPVMLDIAAQVNRLCPDAWIINFTNPAGIVTEAVLKHSPHQKIIGVCNIPYNMRSSIAEIMKVDKNDVEINFIGMNHFVFGEKVSIKGIDSTADVIEEIITRKKRGTDKNIQDLSWSMLLIKSLSMLPSPYHQYYFQKNKMLEADLKAYKENNLRAKIVQKLEKKLFKTYENSELNEKPKELEKRGGSHYSDVACSLMDSIFNNRGDTQTINTVNNGAITDLPPDAVIEVNCIITEKGPEPIKIGSLPESIKGLILHMKNEEELIIKAAITGCYDDAYTALVMNPLVADISLSKAVLDELLEAHQAYLPQFNRLTKEEKNEK